MPSIGGSYHIRGIYPGRLQELEAAFQHGERPRSTPTVVYAKAGEERLTSMWGQMIPLRRVQGQRLHISQSLPITEAVRHALTKYFPDGAPGMLTGHDADTTVLRREHMALVPLPRVDDRTLHDLCGLVS